MRRRACKLSARRLLGRTQDARGHGGPRALVCSPYVPLRSPPRRGPPAPAGVEHLGGRLDAVKQLDIVEAGHHRRRAVGRRGRGRGCGGTVRVLALRAAATAALAVAEGRRRRGSGLREQGARLRTRLVRQLHGGGCHRVLRRRRPCTTRRQMPRPARPRGAEASHSAPPPVRRASPPPSTPHGERAVTDRGGPRARSERGGCAPGSRARCAHPTPRQSRAPCAAARDGAGGTARGHTPPHSARAS